MHHKSAKSDSYYQYYAKTTSRIMTKYEQQILSFISSIMGIHKKCNTCLPRLLNKIKCTIVFPAWSTTLRTRCSRVFSRTSFQRVTRQSLHVHSHCRISTKGQFRFQNIYFSFVLSYQSDLSRFLIPYYFHYSISHKIFYSGSTCQTKVL